MDKWHRQDTIRYFFIPLTLDICCGTGTIGIVLSDSVKDVIGIELSESAVKDAIENVKLNNIQNITFKCGKAESILKQGLDISLMRNLTAIVDPPRSGLHPIVCKTIVKCKAIQQFVYVSCNQKSLVENSKHFLTEFEISKSVAVDLFPHCQHIEFVVLFKRKNL